MWCVIGWDVVWLWGVRDRWGAPPGGGPSRTSPRTASGWAGGASPAAACTDHRTSP